MTMTRAHLDAAAKAWAKARLYDDRHGQADKNRLGTWAEGLASLDATEAEAVDAVTSWYLATGRERAIQIGDVLAEIRTTRRNAVEADHTARIVGSAVEDPQLGGLGIKGADGEPIWDAYEIDDAIEYPCDTCHAGVHEACINPGTGQTRKIPCFTRLAAARRNHTTDSRPPAATERS